MPKNFPGKHAPDNSSIISSRSVRLYHWQSMNAPNPLPETAQSAESPYKSTGGLKRVWNALRYSMRGFGHAWRVESAFRQELILAIVLVPVALFLPVSALERLALLGSVIMVLIVELINSSIEAAVDRISLDPHKLAGRAKDLGSAAVFLALVLCALAWTLIAGPVIITLVRGLHL
jgi:diacylglycerol kinase (ATP)